MTPLQYADFYKNLEVPFADGPVIVQVSKYLSGCHSSPLVAQARTMFSKKDATITCKVKRWQGDYETVTYDWTSIKKLMDVIKDPFNGKGSPEEVQVLLQVGVKCGGLQKADLGSFCASGKIGLDCCGFVSNYVWHTVQNKPWYQDTKSEDLGASNYIPAMLAAGRPIKTEEEFLRHRNQCLVLGKCDPETGVVIKNGPGAHVMITEPKTTILMRSTTVVAHKKGKDSIQWDGMDVPVKTNTTEANTVIVVESTGGGKGLVSSRYSILDVNEKTGVFRVKRGCSNGTLYIRVATLQGQ